jgi:DNA-binding CsgD family transcriptional regulator
VSKAALSGNHVSAEVFLLPEILETVSKIYDAAIDPDDWTAAMESVCDYTQSNGFNIFMLDHETGGVPFSTSVGIPEELLAEYNAYYVTVDPGIKFFTENPNQDFYFNYLHTSEQDMDRHEYYDWLEQAGGARYYLAKTFKQDNRFSVIATSQRNSKLGHAQESDFQNLSLIGPHIGRAVRINQLFRKADLRMAAAYDALERLPYGVFLLTEAGTIIYSNSLAREVISKKDGLEIRGGAVRALNSRDDRRLQVVIRENLKDQPSLQNNSQEYVQISRKDANHPYSLQVLSLLSNHRLFTKEQPTCIIILSDPERKVRVHSDALQSLFGLTPTEARLASLLATGLRPTDICELLSISDNTLRTHRKRILGKVGCETQAQLAQILNAL